MDANIRGWEGDTADKEKIRTTATEKEGARGDAADGCFSWRRGSEDDNDGGGGGGDDHCQQSGHRSLDDCDDGYNGDGDDNGRCERL